MAEVDRSAGTVKVDGLKRLRRTLKAAGHDVTELKTANRSAAEIAATASAALAPRGATGKLAASVRAGATITAGIVRAGKKAVPYANMVHWGRLYWPNAQASPRYRSYVRAQPFVSEGAQNSEGQWRPVYEDFLNDQLDKIKGA